MLESPGSMHTCSHAPELNQLELHARALQLSSPNSWTPSIATAWHLGLSGSTSNPLQAHAMLGILELHRTRHLLANGFRCYKAVVENGEYMRMGKSPDWIMCVLYWQESNQWSGMFGSRSTDVGSQLPLWAVQFDSAPGVNTVNTFMVRNFLPRKSPKIWVAGTRSFVLDPKVPRELWERHTKTLIRVVGHLLLQSNTFLVCWPRPICRVLFG